MSSFEQKIQPLSWIFYGRSRGNRTHANGFGDRCTTIIRYSCISMHSTLTPRILQNFRSSVNWVCMNSSSSPIVSVVTYTQEHQADIAYAKLLAAGIRDAEVVHGAARSWNPFAQQGPGTYAVTVPSIFLKKAKKILRVM